MAHVQHVGIPGTPRLVEKYRADLADDDSKNFWNVPKNSASNDEREEVEKDQTGHLKNSAIGQDSIQRQKWTSFLDPSKSKHNFGLSRGLIFLGG